MEKQIEELREILKTLKSNCTKLEKQIENLVRQHNLPDVN